VSPKERVEATPVDGETAVSCQLAGAAHLALSNCDACARGIAHEESRAGAGNLVLEYIYRRIVSLNELYIKKF
jgi:hypothetical protein